MKKTPRNHLEAAAVVVGRRRALLGLAGGAVAALLPGCGGGGGDEGTAVPNADDERRYALGGVDGGGTGIECFFSAAFSAVMPLTASGVAFDTGGCVFKDGDGALLPAGSVAAGMTGRIGSGAVQTVAGIRTASAVTVVLAEALRGTASNFDMPTRSFSVLGQRVVTKTTTVFDASVGGTLAGVATAGPVRVWGVLDVAGNRIVASRVDAASPQAVGVVRGVLTVLDRDSGLVRIGAFEATAAPGSNAIAAGLAAGAVVRARVQPAAGGSWLLLSLADDALVIPNGLQAEIEGAVTQATSALQFRVDGVAVDASAVFSATSPAPLPGTRAEVHGRMQGGVLKASSVQFEAGDTLLEIEGKVSSVDAAGRRFVLRGYNVLWGPATRFIGGGSTLLKVNRSVAVRARWNAERTGLVAESVHIET